MTAKNDQQNFITARNAALKDYRENSNLTAQFCNSTTDQLAIILVTAALAFLAIITASLGDLELLQSLTICQKIIIATCIVLLVVSIILGIIALVLEIDYLHKTYIKYNGIIDKISQSRGWSDMQEIQDTTIKESQGENKNVGFSFIVWQGTFFALGIIAVIIYVGIRLLGGY